MNFEIKHIDQIKRQLIVTLDKETYNKDYQKALTKFSRNVQISGFRKGKAPISTVLRLYGDRVSNFYLDEYTNVYYQKGLLETNANPVSKGNIGDINIKTDGDSVFIYEFETLPEGYEYEYKDLEVVFKPIEYSEEMLDQTINQILKNNAEEIPFEENQALELGDKVTVYDILNEKELEPFILDQELIVKNPDPAIKRIDANQLVGLKLKDGFTLDKDECFQIEKAFKIIIPELNEETAKILGHESVEALKNSLKENIEKDISTKNKNQSNLAISKAFGERNINNILIPEDYLIRIGKRMLMQHFRGQIDPEKFDGFEDKFLLEIADSQKPSIIWELVFERIAKDHNIAVSEDEFDEEITQLALLYSVSADDFKKNYANSLEDIKEEFLSRKVLDFIRPFCNFVESASTEEIQIVEDKPCDTTDCGDCPKHCNQREDDIEKADFEVIKTIPEEEPAPKKRVRKKATIEKTSENQNTTEDSIPAPKKKRQSKKSKE
ncbi:MAG: hypothetical protein FWG98_10750 [Candidatus Cloacimonetes bacterium]|nr:hypothetical protein [Candidatus Cloacimonadota bacterium]